MLLSNLFCEKPANSVQKWRGDKTTFSVSSHASWIKAVKLWRQYGKKFLAACSLRSCPACGEEKSTFLYTSYDEHPFHRCTCCGCWFEPHLVDENLFKNFFEAYPEAAAVAEEMARERLALISAQSSDQNRFAQLFELLDIFTPGALLDIGANAGQFIAAAQERGWDAWGLESDRFALAEAAARGRQVVGSMPELPSIKWNMATLWETIEHVADPLGLLSNVEKSLAPEGVIIFTFPNLNNLQLQQMRGDCFYSHGGYNTAGHINFFGIRQFAALLARVGMEPVFWDGMYSSDYILQWGYLKGKAKATDVTFEELEGSGFYYPGFLEEIASGLALVERQGLNAPILLCVACRSSEKEQLQERVKHLEKVKQISLKKQRCEAYSRYKIDYSSEYVIPFTLNEATTLKVLLCSDNPKSKQTGILLGNTVVAPAGAIISENGQADEHVVQFTQTKRRRGLFSNLLKFEKDEAGNVVLISKKVNHETLARSQSITLPAGEYLLEGEAVVFMGKASIALLDEKTNQVCLQPVNLHSLSIGRN